MPPVSMVVLAGSGDASAAVGPGWAGAVSSSRATVRRGATWPEMTSSVCGPTVLRISIVSFVTGTQSSNGDPSRRTATRRASGNWVTRKVVSAETRCHYAIHALDPTAPDSTDRTERIDDFGPASYGPPTGLGPAKEIRCCATSCKRVDISELGGWKDDTRDPLHAPHNRFPWLRSAPSTNQFTGPSQSHQAQPRAFSETAIVNSEGRRICRNPMGAGKRRANGQPMARDPKPLSIGPLPEQ